MSTRLVRLLIERRLLPSVEVKESVLRAQEGPKRARGVIKWYGIDTEAKKQAVSLREAAVPIAKAHEVLRQKLFVDSTKRKGDSMPRIYDKTCGRFYTVSSKVKVGKPGSPRWRAYCARASKIRGGQGKCSRNRAQMRRWKC